MFQQLLVGITCKNCGKKYYEQGYHGDGQFCVACSLSRREEEENKNKKLADRAREIAEKLGLDLKSYARELPEEIRKELNPRNAGRKPVKWNDSYCEILVGCAAEGKSETEFAAMIGVSQSLLTAWTDTHENFKTAREVANELRNAWLENNYRLAMLGQIECVPSMMIRAASAKLGWSEKSEAEIKRTGEIPVVRIVEPDAAFPSETLTPTSEQIAERDGARAVQE